MRKTIQILILAILVGCNFAENINPYWVDEEIEPFMELYRSTALANGVKLKKSRKNIHIEFIKFQGANHDGGIVNRGRPGRITLYIDFGFWNRMVKSDEDKIEFLWPLLNEGFGKIVPLPTVNPKN